MGKIRVFLEIFLPARLLNFGKIFTYMIIRNCTFIKLGVIFPPARLFGHYDYSVQQSRGKRLCNWIRNPTKLRRDLEWALTMNLQFLAGLDLRVWHQRILHFAGQLSTMHFTGSAQKDGWYCPVVLCHLKSNYKSLFFLVKHNK